MSQTKIIPIAIGHYKVEKFINACPLGRVCQCAESVQNHEETPSTHYFGPKGFTKWKINQKKLMLEGGHYSGTG